MKEKPVNTPIRKNTRKVLKQHAIEADMTIVDYLDMVLHDHWRKVDALRATKLAERTAKLSPSERAANGYAEVVLSNAAAAEVE